MPNYYEISPTDDVLTLQQGQGAAGFTVRYMGERPVEAKAEAVALQGADPSWLQVAQPATKDMQSNQTQTFKVLVNVPQGTPAGRYGLRLDVMSVNNTDEEYNQGPVVSFEVSETAAPPPQKEPGISWWGVIVVVVVLAILAGGIVWWVLGRKNHDPGDPGKPLSPVTSLASRIDFTRKSGGFMVAETLQSSGIASVAAMPRNGYCADAVPAILPAGRYRLPAPVLSTASPGNLDRCNGVELRFRLAQPASRVSVAFFGANTPYKLTAYDSSNHVIAAKTANGTPYRYETPITLEISQDEALIDHFEFGHQAALTMIQAIEIDSGGEE